MKTCLTKRALLLCVGGDGTDEQLDHIASCEYCRGRYLRFVRDLETIECVLGEGLPLSSATPADFGMPWRNRWLPLAAAFAATVVLVWGIGRLQQPAAPDLVSSGEEEEDVAPLLQDDESPLLLAMADRREFVVPASVADARYLEAALNDGWPCEWQDEFFPPTCEFYPISLAFEEQ